MKNFYLLIILSFFGGNILAQSFSDPNFSVSTIVSGWTEPVGAAFSKDAEKLFVWEKAGFVYVCNKSGANYVKQTDPVIDLTAEVLNWRDHGLMGFALDPDYLTNGYVYLLYIVDRRFLMNDNSIAADEGHDATIARLTRYRIINNGGNLVADAASRTILIGETPSTGIAVVHESHVIGSLAFAADGTLLVSTGDAASYYLMDAGSDSDTYWGKAITDGIIRTAENVGAFRSQIVNCHNGKLLRIDPVTGNGISSNPFYSGTEPRAAKSRVWAMGFRNPFRILIRPGTGSANPAAGDIGEVYAGDVGWGTWEEFTIITGPGQNAGWPVYEGHEINSQYNTRAATLQNMDEPNPLAGQTGCSRPYFTFRELIKDPTADENKTINNPCNAAVAIGTGNRYVHRRPAIDYKHEQESARVGIFSGNNAAVAEIGTAQSGVVGTPFAGNCALSGVWYTGDNFPPEYKNSFLLVDHTARWIKRFTIDYTDVITRVDNLVMVFANIVSAAENPIDGTLAVVDITTNTVKKIQYGGNQPPVAVPKANITYGASPLTVNFTGNTSYDLSPGGSIASYSWDFGGGSPATSTAANPTGIIFTDATGNPKKFVVKLTVTDNGGATDVDSVIVSVNNTPPVVNITSPVKNSTYPLGGDAVYNCTATVTDNEHTAAQLKYEWQTILRHNNHEHPEAIDNNVNTTTRISRIGCNGDNYYWLIRLKVTDAAGLSTTDSSKIFPDCGSDNIPPVVTSISPANGAAGVSISTAVSADFSEAIDASTVTSSTFQLKDEGNNIITAPVSTSSNQITLVPLSALSGSMVYTATIKGGSSGVKDLAGNALASDYSWSFTTVAVDNTPPTITSVSPLNGATGVSTGTTVIANFSEAINASTVTVSTVQLRDESNNLIGVAINTSGSQITLTPSAALNGSTVYTATITGGTSGVKDLAGNALASDYSWSFTTVAVDNTPPAITSVSPINGATGVSTGTTVIANFSETINASTVTGTTFQLRDAGNNLIAATINVSGSQISLTPLAALTGTTVYTVTITGGTSGVKDLAGNALVSNYVWSFTTTNVDNTPPTVSAVSPVSGATDISVSTTVTANFSEAINASTVTTSTFQLRNPANTLITATVSVSGNQIVLTPSAALTGSTVYTATITGGASGVKDLAGNALATNYSWSFTTIDNIPPAVSSVSPASGATGVAISTTVTASFNEAINASTVTTSTVQLRNPANTLITATISVSGNQITLTPSAALANSTVYTVTITGGASGVKDLAGNALASNYSWSFTTVAATSQSPVTIQSFTTKTGTAATSHSLTGVPAGALLVLATTADAVPSNASVSSSPSLTWTKRADAGATNSDNAEIWTALYSAGGSITVTSNWGTDNSQSSVCYVVLNAEPTLGGAFGTATLQASPSVTITTTRENSIIFGCTADWKAISGTTRTLRDGATERLYFKDGNFTTYHYTKAAASIAAYTEGVSLPTGQQASTSLLEIRGNAVAANIPPTVTTQPTSQTRCAGTNASFTSAASGTPAPTVQWQESTNGTTWTNITGATGATLSFATTTADNNKQYRAVWTNSVSSVNSNAAILTVNAIPATPSVTVTNNCGNSLLAATGTTGTLLWSNGATTASITVTTAGTYIVTQTINGCTSAAGTGIAAPLSSPAAPAVAVVNNCGSSLLTASGFTGTLLWNNGATSSSITVTTGGTYTVTQTVSGCTSAAGSNTAAPKTVPAAPDVAVVNNCGNSVLTASGFTGTLLWSNGATTNPITVTLAGTYTVTQTVNGCTSAAGSNTAAPVNSSVDPPIVDVDNNCGNSVLTASGYTGTLLWSNGATTASITVNTPGTYTVTQTVSGCTSPASSGVAAPDAIPPAPGVSVSNNCGSSILTASGFTGSLIWNTGETITSISVTNPGTYTVTQTVNGCTSAAGSNTAAPKTVPAAPDVAVVNNCGNSVLTASGFTGSLLWSNGATTNPITVTTGGTYTVTQTVNGCISEAGSGTAAPLNSSVVAPSVSVVNNCTNSVLTASDYTGSLLWSNGATTPSITVTTAATYTVTQTVSGCTSPAGSGTATPVNTTIAVPAVAVTNNCGGSVLTASGFTGSLLWSTGETTAIINVTTAGTYTVTQTVDGCTSNAGSGIAAPNSIPATPSVSVTNNCGNSVLTATGVSGTLLWSNGATTNPITVTVADVYTVTQTVNGCISGAGSGTAAPLNSSVTVPSVSVVNNCTNSVLTASDYTGSLLWSNGATTPSITVTTAATYTVTQTVSGCTSPAGSGSAAPVNTTIVAPAVSVANNCGNSVLTASGFTGSLLWSNGATTNPITVATANTYTVTQTIDGCTGPAGSGVAAPKPIPVLSSSLTATATSGTAYTYTATSATGGTTFAWSRAAVTGISNATASGTGNINETLVNTTASPVNVTYVYTLTANGCINTQNLVVTVNPAATTNCVINSSITSSFNSTSIPAGRYIWFSNVFDRGSFSGITGTVTFTVTNSVITFTANSQQYTLNVPNSRIRFDAAVISATTQFVNNVWETAVPRSYNGYVFMGGLAYQVPASLPGNITNVIWTATISIDKAGVSLTRRWAAAVYTSFAAHSGLNIKPKNGSTQNPYPNNDNAGTPENFKPSVVAGAKGNGGTNYTGSYSSTSTATCVVTVAQRSSAQAAITQPSFAKQIPALSIENLSAGKLEVNIMPNPSNTYFNLVIKGSNKNPVTVRVIDILGQVVERHEKIASSTVLQLGHKWASGPYFVEVIQADQRKFVKIIKVN